MHDVLVHYLEVNFPEIAEQLAHTHGREPTNEERAAAAERLRELIRRLRRGAEAAGAPPHAPRASAAEMIAGVNGELSADERAVLDHFFELFARSMQRTQAAIAASPEAAAAATQPPAEAASATPAAPVAPVAEPATETAVSTQEPAVEAQPVEPPPVAQEPLPVTSAPEAPPPVATAPPEAQAARLVPEQMAGPLQTILLAAAQQALDLLQVDASQVYTLGEQRRFVLRAGVPTESLAAPEGVAAVSSGLLRRALEHNEVFTVEDLAAEELTADEAAWLDAGFRGFAAIALSPPLERPVGVLALFRRTPWRLDRRDAVRLEDLAVEAVAALRAHSLAIKVAEVAVLQERLNLAREIHDGLASDLAAVVALFKYYEQRRQRDPEDAGQLLPQLRTMTEEILAGARNILKSLRPKTIRSEGLMASVLKLVDQFGRVNLVETNVNIRGEENTISAEQKEVIFQVLRESLSNVRKHSQARNLWVLVDLSSSPWVLTVRDDGRGFDVRRVAEDPKKVGSYGLVGMRERAELIGGALEIVSQSLEGTLVTLIGPEERSE
ncbi:MAG: GAF domain-containing sensor histidine kinase [Chloroflexi bacterium]|nr:MAG: GAF domain-containing sensor histidine kinase [Chloroflexota bacterium]